ncbi:alpha/beta hydrolase [Deinococcus seoulensis]|uniref:Alpha/beta hydrolase n=1 Tax=Deinococcus seoulensis TaxID=1837379 RepID=A0ABQ2RPI3_9DEIO|nr:alpha/beta fold hydrolase [Deinococcus seoulensis]GGR47308.1 alpha/beta hydrolase [Deinococcus seoulensis]
MSRHALPAAAAVLAALMFGGLSSAAGQAAPPASLPDLPAPQDVLALDSLALDSLALDFDPGVVALTDPAQPTLDAVPARRVVRPGVTVPGTPASLNASITVRYGPDVPQAVLLLMPGYLGGAGSFDRLARQIVTLHPTWAVWAVDRRSNLLEDHSALLGRDIPTLQRIVRSGLPPRTAASVPFMKDWGLDTTLRDWHEAVMEARKLTPNVFIGGHSMGGTLSGLYAAYDFGGIAGERDVRGLVMLDGLPGLMSGTPLTADEYAQAARNPLGPLPGLNGLTRDPYVQSVIFSPKLASRAAAQARLAALAPDAPAPTGGLTLFPATNLAAAMTQLEQRYALLPFLTLNTGRATNASEAPNLGAQLLGASFPGAGDARWIVGPQDPARPVGWQTDPAAPTDPQDFARRFVTPLSDYSEWYFPNRLTLDLAAARTDTRGTPFEKTLPVWHGSQITLPILGVAAAQGVTTEAQYRQYAATTRAALTTRTLPDAAHLDITVTRGDQVARWITDWMQPLTR